MKIISNPTQDKIIMAAKALKDGYLVAFPTETVYGLGADATNEKAVSRIYSVKGRPTDHPLIVHISSINQLDKWTIDIPDYAIELAKKFWPGPMTLILKRNSLARDFITGGQGNIGIRVPDQSVALRLLNEFEKLGGLGIAAPSANRFGAVSPTTALAVEEELSRFLSIKDLILDGGECMIGIESTIIDCTKSSPIILRSGKISINMVKKLIGHVNYNNIGETNIKASGLLKFHYSPKAQVVLNKFPEYGEGFIALNNIPTPIGVVRLAAPSNISEYAKCLYKALREGDKKKLNKIFVWPPSGDGLAIAINDRLSKASKISGEI